jgi:hypothetical protein
MYTLFQSLHLIRNLLVVTIFLIASFFVDIVGSDVIRGALPLVVVDCEQSDTEDTLSYVSTYRLRKSFEFDALLSQRDLHPKDVYPSGDVMVVDAPVSLLVEQFQHLTKKQLLLLGQNHGIDFMSGGRKEVYRHLLITHKCAATCTRTPFVFRQRTHARLDASKPSYLSSDELDRHRR